MSRVNTIISRFMMPPLVTEEERLLFGEQGLLVGEGKIGGQMWKANTKKQVCRGEGKSEGQGKREIKKLVNSQ